jgi:hypothetical protein
MADNSTIVDFHTHSGFSVFDCRDCGIHTVSYFPEDREPVCRLCRFIRAHPELSPDMIARLRGGTLDGR